MTDSSTPTDGSYTLDGIEVVELSEIDLDFTVEEAFRDGAPRITDSNRTEPAKPEELAKLELLQGIGGQELAALAGHCESIHTVPGYVLLAPGRLNTKIFFVVDGQLRLYGQTGDKRPVSVADIGHSTGLRSALAMQPAEHAVIATEQSHVLVMDVKALEDFAKRSHKLARNYMALLASYVRDDHCLHVGKPLPAGAQRPGYIDELTLLHNQQWLDTVFPRVVARCRMGGRSLSVTAFAIDQLEQSVKEHGIGAGLRVLEAVGHWTLDQTRPTDVLAVNKNRHIFVFLPDCDLDAARQLGGRLKSLIQSAPVSLALDKKPTPIPITLSLGIASLEKGMKENEFLDHVEALIGKSIKLGGNWLSDKLP
jgi:diguanylate cyclase (GGDEF)-like protein